MAAVAGIEPATPAPRSVFISYSRQDRARAQVLVTALERAGFAVHWDGLLTGGDAFLTTIEAMLESADAVIVLWSEASINSHWVRDEATRGVERNCLVPVVLDGSKPPLGFRQIQFVDLAGWAGQAKAPAFAELLRAIDSVLSDGTVQNRSAAPLSKPVRFNRRAMLIGGAAVVAGGGALAGWKAGLLDGGAAVNSIAVLPFRNLSPDPAKAYFSDGLAEELRAMLSLNRQIEVAAQSSSSALLAAKLDVPGVAKKLDVAYVLEGSVQSAGSQLRLIARLVDGRSGFEQWSQVFDREFSDVLAVQREVATMVTDSLVSTMLGGGKAEAVRIGGTDQAGALDAYLRGAALYSLAQDEATDRQALAAFDAAVRIDPGYAVAHAARSRALTVIGSSYGSGDEVAGLNAQALTAARRAVELAPDLAEGQAALGLILMNGQLDLAAARLPMEQCYERGFGNAGMLTSYATFAGFAGLFAEAREAMARAKRLDPLNPTVWRNSGQIEFSARDFAAAEGDLRKALSLNAKATIANQLLGDMAIVRGDLLAAERSYKSETSPLSQYCGLAIVRHLSGDLAGAKRSFDSLIDQFGNNSLYQQTQVLVQWGENAHALDVFEQGYKVRDAGLLLASGDPLLDPIRQDPRFKAVLRQLGADGAQAV